MIVTNSIPDFLEAQSGVLADTGARVQVGFVPTMGYLHAGHASLIRRARAENDVVVVSIFVNPLQFGPNEDLDRYPRNPEADAQLCESLGVDILFVPTVEAMYGSAGIRTSIHVADLGDHLCGAVRPVHFDGVCTVVAKLFQIVRPTSAYFGRKDAQQWRIVRQMVNDLSMPIQVIACDIVREPDGLAMSSRNAYLSAEQRRQALALRETLSFISDQVHGGIHDVQTLSAAAVDRLSAYPELKLDYLSFVDGETLQPVQRVGEDGSVLCAIAAYLGTTRLIDNVEL